MARTAKCRICGKQLNTDTAFKVEGKPAKYFCTKQEYEAEEERKKKAAEDKDKAYTLICRIIGRETIINTALWAEWKVWSKVADDTKIGQFLAENEEYLTGMIGKLVDAEFPRIRYLSTVLKNRLGDYKPNVVEEVKVQDKVQEVAKLNIAMDQTFEVYTGPTNTNNQRRSFDEME